MRVGITGYPGAGKTTVFNCLTGADASVGYGGREIHRGMITVPDPRIDKLSALFTPKKTTYANVSFLDIPTPEGADGNGVDTATATELRKTEAVVVVLRGFGAGHGYPPRNGSVDPARDLVDFDQELALLDLMVLEKRRERLEKERKKDREMEILTEVLPQMEDGERPLRKVPLDEATLAQLTGFALLSLKPQLALLNLDDDATPEEAEAQLAAVREVASPRGIDVMSLRGNIELEISRLSAEDQAGFLDDLGLTEPARARFIRTCYGMLDLISFFTVGEDEVRAWTIDRGTPAVRAAGKIHSDLERGFIRAETVAYEDFIAVGGKMAKAREAGKLRLEGKEYVVADGDILNIRFNV